MQTATVDSPPTPTNKTTPDSPSTQFTNTAKTTAITTARLTKTTASSTAMAYPSTPTSPDTGGLALVIGLSVGVIVIVSCAIIITICLLRRRRRRYRRPPPVLPDLSQRVPRMPRGTSTTTVSTANLISSICSAESLPIAPKPPTELNSDYHDFDRVDDEEEEERTSQTDIDYLEPSKWRQQPKPDDLYLAMTPSLPPLEPQTKVFEGPDHELPPQRLSSVLIDARVYAEPAIKGAKPKLCSASINLGYINVPGSGDTVPKYANSHVDEHRNGGTELYIDSQRNPNSSEDTLEDYENVPHATLPKSKKRDMDTLPKYANVSEGISPKTNRSNPSPKASPKVATKPVRCSKPSSPKHTPKVKPKQMKSKGHEAAQGGPDYVNVQQYSKRPQKAKTLDIVELGAGGLKKVKK